PLRPKKFDLTGLIGGHPRGMRYLRWPWCELEGRGGPATTQAGTALRRPTEGDSTYVNTDRHRIPRRDDGDRGRGRGGAARPRPDHPAGRDRGDPSRSGGQVPRHDQPPRGGGGRDVGDVLGSAVRVAVLHP